MAYYRVLSYYDTVLSMSVASRLVTQIIQFLLPRSGYSTLDCLLYVLYVLYVLLITNIIQFLRNHRFPAAVKAD
jgi:hypothetical protein